LSRKDKVRSKRRNQKTGGGGGSDDENGGDATRCFSSSHVRTFETRARTAMRRGGPLGCSCLPLRAQTAQARAPNKRAEKQNERRALSFSNDARRSLTPKTRIAQTQKRKPTNLKNNKQMASMFDPNFGSMFGAIDRAMDSALRRAFAAPPGAAAFGAPGPLALAPPPAGGPGVGALAFPSAGLGAGELAPWGTMMGGAGPTGSAMLPYMPAADVAEHSDRYEVHLDAPGLSEDDVSVTLHGGVLHVRAHPRPQSVEERDAATGRLIRRERFSSSWARAFALPADADDEGTDEGVAASLDRGLLTVVVPKKKAAPEQEGRAPKRIAVRPGRGAKKGKHAASGGGAGAAGGAGGAGAAGEDGGGGGGSAAEPTASGSSPKAAAKASGGAKAKK
jgi:HSP20 family protein